MSGPPRVWRAAVVVGACLLAGCDAEPSELLGALDPVAEPTPAAGEPQSSAAAAVDEPMIGLVVPAAEVELRSPDVAQVTAVEVAVGDRVTAGQTLVQLDGWRQREQLDTQTQALRVARADAERAGLEASHAADERARAESIRDRLPGQELRALAHERSLTRARVRTARAVVEQRRHEVERAQEAVDRGELVAPFDGFVAHRFVDVGDSVAPQERLLSLLSDARTIRFAVPESMQGRIEVEQAVDIHTADGRVLPATVTAVAPEIDAATRLTIAQAQLQLQLCRAIEEAASPRLPLGDAVTVRLSAR